MTTTGGATSGATETGGEPTTSGGSSGESGGAGETSTGEVSTSESSTGAASAESTSGEGCIGCEASFNGEPGALCTESAELLDVLFQCVCGTCAEVCEATCTMNAPPSQGCSSCQSDAFAGECARELMACLAD